MRTRAALAHRDRPLRSPSHAMYLAPILAILGIASCSSASSSTDKPQSYELGPSECQLNSSLTGPSGKRWTACDMRFTSSTNTYTWTFMPPGTSGSLIYPGDGWIVLTFNLDSPENASLPLSTVVQTMPASVPVDQVVFAYGLGNGRAGGTGSVTVGDNRVNTHGGGGLLSGSLNIHLTTGDTLSGMFSAIASAASAGGGGSGGGGSGGGGGSCSGSSSACASETQKCQQGGQGPCYCAAACLCAASCNTTCQQQNHAGTVDVNYPCPW